MAKYWKKAFVVEAMQWLRKDGGMPQEMADWLNACGADKWEVDKSGELLVLTSWGPIIMREGDWVVQGSASLHPCTRSAFEQQYVPCDEAVDPWAVMEQLHRDIAAEIRIMTGDGDHTPPEFEGSQEVLVKVLNECAKHEDSSQYDHNPPVLRCKLIIRDLIARAAAKLAS